MTAAAVAQLTEAVLALAVVALAMLPLRLSVAVLLPCKYMYICDKATE
jgi:hypothetical protein